MAKHLEFGVEGENLAAKYLESKGYTILDRNWRWRKAEVDLFVRGENKLILVEVKTRSRSLEQEEDLISENKALLLQSALEAYMKEKNISLEARIDLIKIEMPNKLKHFKAAVQASFE